MPARIPALVNKRMLVWAREGLLASTPSVAQGIINNVSGLDNDPRMFQISLPE
jgi:hypothetical protein